MAKRNVRIRAVRRDQVDIDKLVSGLLLLLEELAADTETNCEGDTAKPGETSQ